MFFGAAMMSVVLGCERPELGNHHQPPRWLIGLLMGGLLCGPLGGLVCGGLLGPVIGTPGSAARGAAGGCLFGGLLGAVSGAPLLAALLWNRIDSPYLVARGEVPAHPPYWIVGASWGALAGLVTGMALGAVIGGVLRLQAGRLRKLTGVAAAAVIAGLLAGWIVQLLWWHRLDALLRHGWWAG
jgi:hypothetical protein